MDKDYRLVKRQVKLEMSAKRYQNSRGGQALSKQSHPAQTNATSPSSLRSGANNSRAREKDLRSKFEEPDVVLVASVRVPQNFVHRRELFLQTCPALGCGKCDRTRQNRFFLIFRWFSVVCFHLPTLSLLWEATLDSQFFVLSSLVQKFSATIQFTGFWPCFFYNSQPHPGPVAPYSAILSIDSCIIFS